MRLKKIILFSLIFAFIFSIINCTFATESEFSLSDIIDKGADYTDGSGDEIVTSDAVANIVNPIVNALMTIGAFVVVAVRNSFRNKFYYRWSRKTSSIKATGDWLSSKYYCNLWSLWNMEISIYNIKQ